MLRIVSPVLENSKMFARLGKLFESENYATDTYALVAALIAFAAAFALV